MKWLWKFVDGAKTAGELYGRALVVFACQHYANQLALPTSQRRGSVLPSSHRDTARKAFEKLTKQGCPPATASWPARSSARRASTATGSPRSSSTPAPPRRRRAARSPTSSASTTSKASSRTRTSRSSRRRRHDRVGGGHGRPPPGPGAAPAAAARARWGWWTGKGRRLPDARAIRHANCRRFAVAYGGPCGPAVGACVRPTAGRSPGHAQPPPPHRARQADAQAAALPPSARRADRYQLHPAGDQGAGQPRDQATRRPRPRSRAPTASATSAPSKPTCRPAPATASATAATRRAVTAPAPAGRTAPGRRTDDRRRRPRASSPATSSPRAPAPSSRSASTGASLSRTCPSAPPSGAST